MDNRSLKNLILSHLGNRCTICGASSYLHIHHAIPLYVGGKNEMSNVELLCKTCHSKVHKSNKGVYKKLIEDKATAMKWLRKLVAAGILDKSDIPDNLRVLL